MLTIFLFRDDLRLEDNPGFTKAARSGPVLPLYVLDDAAMTDDLDDPHRLGGAARWWLHHSLASLDGALRERGSRLTVMRGDPFVIVTDLVRSTNAAAVHLSRGYSPWDVELERRLNETLAADGKILRRFGGRLLFEPESVSTKSGDPFKVFTPFWRACQTLDDPSGHTAPPDDVAAPDSSPDGVAIDTLGLLPHDPDWSTGIAAAWQPGEAGARIRLENFLDDAADDYGKGRDVPSIAGTSRLSPHLRWGEISPRTIWQAVRQRTPQPRGAEAYLRELGWRDFCHHLLFHFPTMPVSPMREPFDAIDWCNDAQDIRRWQRGRTGYPIVDAGMRELWRTGWMHNRVRMAAASFLVKHLLTDWRIGAAWFMDTLVDADPANNSAGWQWVTGCGTDAAPYFRVFNPTLQGEKFDADGAYVRHWLPTLGDVETKYIHKPWEAPADAQPDYPPPIVDHKTARQRALDRFGVVKSAS
ncbi:MAG: deoxyribodipyrimidine photo-lyase [Rhodospirillales bacterium]